MKTFKQKILGMVDVPVERISFRKDKWGELATVYFHGKFRAVSIGDDTMDKDMVKSFLNSIKHGSSSMVE